MLNSALRLVFLICCLLWSTVQAQNTVHTVRGQVRETFNNKAPIAFVHIVANDNLHFFTDMEGFFEISSTEPITQLEFKSNLFRPLKLSKQQITKELNIQLNRYLFFYFDEQSSPEALQLIRKVAENKQRNNPLKQKPFDYQAYTKLVFTSDSIMSLKKKANKVLRFFSRNIASENNDHHLFVMESATERRYQNSLKQKEKVISSNVSGVESRSALTLMSQWQPFSFYEDYVNIGGEIFISPLAGKPELRYIFSVVDTAITSTRDTVYTVKFNPLHARQVAALKGYFFINTKGYAIEHAEAMPARDSETKFVVHQSAVEDGGRWFPSQTKTLLTIRAKGIPIKGSNKTYIYNPRFGQGKMRIKEKDVVLDFTTGTPQDSAFWENVRQEHFTQKDANTFRFYDQMGHFRDFDKFLGTSTRLAQGKLPMGMIDIDLRRFFRASEYEGLRIGTGLSTNHKFSEIHEFSGYAGYGLRDQQWKYGVSGSTLLYEPLALQAFASNSLELAEPGAVNFAFDKAQYKSEAQRRYRLPVMDLTNSSEIALRLEPFSYAWFQAGFKYQHIKPKYDYTFQDQTIDRLDLAETQLAFRYSFGEKFVQLPHDRISLGTKFPEIWVQLTQGLDQIGGDFSYQKWDAKLQYKRKVLGFGETGIQIAVGKANGTLPYSALYNAKGSYREASTVTHNSFETMSYNEFLSDKYWSVHFSHNFGKIYIPYFPFYPSLQVVHNFGYGYLSNPQAHQQIKFKTMEKGYFESGFFINDLFVLKLGGLKAGIGAGSFFRYGPNRLPSNTENVFFKFALTFNV